MDCPRARQLIQLELDGSLGPAEARELAAHLSACADCRSEREALVAIDGALAAEPVLRAPASMREVVMASVLRRAGLRKTAEPLIISGAIIVGAAAAVFGMMKTLGSGAAQRAGGLLDAASRAGTQGFGSVAEKMPGILSAWAQDPGIAGVIWALAIVVASILAVVALRQARQFKVGWP